MTGDRPRTLGSSEIAAVVGMNPYCTALDVWANVDAHEEICQALFAPLDPLGQYQDVFLVNAYATRPMKFRLYGATTATVYATAKSGTGSGVLAYPWFMGKLSTVPAVSERLQIQYTSAYAVQWLGTTWYRSRTA